MARANAIKLGQIWKDSKGRDLEIIGPQGSDGKFKVLNHATGRTISRGPRAFVSLVYRAPPGAQPAALPKSRRKKKKRGAPRQMSAAQLAYFGKGKKRKTARSEMNLAPNPVLSTQTPSYQLDSIRNGGYMQPGASPFSGMSRNPGNYPSALTKFIAEALANMDPNYASAPYQVSRVVGQAIANFGG